METIDRLFNDYQEEAIKTAFYTGDGLVYCTLGLTGEAGEFAEQVKKMLRDDDGKLTVERKLRMIKELGDVLWYLANLADSLDVGLGEIAEANLNKIRDRKERGVQRGSGDDR